LEFLRVAEYARKTLNVVILDIEVVELVKHLDQSREIAINLRPEGSCLYNDSIVYLDPICLQVYLHFLCEFFHDRGRRELETPIHLLDNFFWFVIRRLHYHLDLGHRSRRVRICQQGLRSSWYRLRGRISRRDGR